MGSHRKDIACCVSLQWRICFNGTLSSSNGQSNQLNMFSSWWSAATDHRHLPMAWAAGRFLHRIHTALTLHSHCVHTVVTQPLKHVWRARLPSMNYLSEVACRWVARSSDLRLVIGWWFIAINWVNRCTINIWYYVAQQQQRCDHVISERRMDSLCLNRRVVQCKQACLLR